MSLGFSRTFSTRTKQNIRRAVRTSRQRSAVRRPVPRISQQRLRSVRRPVPHVTRRRAWRPPTRRKITRPPTRIVSRVPSRIHQRKPQVSLVTKKQPLRRPVQRTPYNRPTIFATKPFRITRSNAALYRPRRHTPILTRYSRQPRADYQARYRSAVSRNRNLTSRINKVQQQLNKHQKDHTAREAKWTAEKKKYESSPAFAVNKVSKDVMKRYAKAARVFSPSVNGVQSIGGTGETLSRAGAAVVGLVLLGLIIGRVE